jgi:TolA-binding protein
MARSQMTRWLELTGALALLAGVAVGQTSPEEQAKRLLEDGRGYRTQGKAKQALDSFQTVVSGFQNTESVDDALLEIGRYYLDVESNVDKARDAFDQVAKRFPQSDSAPGAYYYLGLLTMDKAQAPAELDDALAQFTRVQRLYPRSEWVPRALHASGLALRKVDRLADAVEAQRRVALEYPSSDVAPAAQFQIGHCLALSGEPRQAMEEFQQVRNRFPESEWAARALDRTTALYRLYAAGKPVFALDTSYTIGAGDILKEVRALLMTPQRTLWIASDKANSVVPYDPAGKMGPSLTSESVRALALSARGELVVTARLAVRFGPRDVRSFSIPSDKPGVPEPLDKLAAAVVTSSGAILVSDDKKKKIYRFDAQGQPQGVFGEAREREVTRLLLDGEGAVVTLDRADKTVRSYDANGKLLRTVGPRGTGYELKKPVDVAVDAARNLYVADEGGAVYILSPQGQLLATLSEAKKPQAVTLDPAGAVFVYDESVQRVLRFK